MRKPSDVNIKERKQMTKNKLFKNKDINSDKTLSVNLEDIKNPMDLIDALTKRNEYHNKKPVPMTEDQEYRNAGITKEEARKNDNNL